VKRRGKAAGRSRAVFIMALRQVLGLDPRPDRFGQNQVDVHWDSWPMFTRDRRAPAMREGFVHASKPGCGYGWQS